MRKTMEKGGVHFVSQELEFFNKIKEIIGRAVETQEEKRAMKI